jgi:hypothetical protein
VDKIKISAIIKMLKGMLCMRCGDCCDLIPDEGI